MTPARAPEGSASWLARLAALASSVALVDDGREGYRAARLALREVARLLADGLDHGAADTCALRRALADVQHDAERAARVLADDPSTADTAGLWEQVAGLARYGLGWWEPCAGCPGCREQDRRAPSLDAVRRAVEGEPGAL